ncbi:MAG: hypothetical protein GY850_27425, partial [bacterium]|nr:hypothetical protein [bacterium]
MASEGADVTGIFYGQMPALKMMMNKIKWEEKEQRQLAIKVIEWDRTISNALQENIPASKMEHFFPTVAVEGVKNMFTSK